MTKSHAPASRPTHVFWSLALSATVALAGGIGSYYQAMQQIREQVWSSRTEISREIHGEVTRALQSQAVQSYPVNREYFFDRRQGEQLQSDIAELRRQVAEVREIAAEIRATLKTAHKEQ